MGSPFRPEPPKCLEHTEVVLTTGVMGSGKTAALINLAERLERAGKPYVIVKPMTDTRTTEVWSRDGRERPCFQLANDGDLEAVLDEHKDVEYILVDEAQFFNARYINQLCVTANEYKIPHLCFYSLKTDYLDNLFEGWKEITDYANRMFELQMRCEECGIQNAVHNHRVSGEEVLFVLGTDNYQALCHKCKRAKTQGGK